MDKTEEKKWIAEVCKPLDKKELSKTLDKIRSEVSHISAWMRLASQTLEEE